MIIVGGGIMGSSAAYYAARDGLRVLLFERDTPGSAQSGRNLGFVRQQARDFREVPLAMGAIRLWQDLERDLGRNLGWHQGGNIVLALSEADLEWQEAWQKEAQGYGLDTQLLNAAQVSGKLPGLAPDAKVKGAMFTASDGRAEPAKATRAFLEIAVEHGAEVISGLPVSKLETTAGHVTGVWCAGRLYRAQTIICAAGAKSAALLRPLGIVLPQEIIRATVAKTEPLDAAFPLCVSCPMTGMRQAADGSLHLSVAGGEYDVRLDSIRYASWYMKVRKEQPDASRINYLSPLRALLSRTAPPPLADIPLTRDCVPPNPARIDQALTEAAHFFPAFAKLRVRASWAGYIDTLPDMIPAIGTVSKTGGLLVATGFSGHGFGLGPMVGRTLAHLVQGQHPEVDISQFSPERFG
ncbi:NAD(P)/FAD-dependent oxidoreductase [Leisingera daeponensis]|uniref:NAD(P)/FAD-dependent oxidoreductase n=1 Tax=Leisingera daeponensis TaxID=405746 RepID=UPI001C93F580|nr:FAD-binding oxidoreductase [Leisingera daeponensis]MBY6058586.1 FAD-binding oxidoreductase [Leisingera daeponensis]